MKNVVKHTQLTAPGNGTAVNLGSPVGAKETSYKVTVATIDTNVIVKYQFSNDGFSTSVDTQSHTITANGTYIFQVPVGNYNQGRPVWVSESGGTAATVDFETIIGQ